MVYDQLPWVELILIPFALDVSFVVSGLVFDVVSFVCCILLASVAYCLFIDCLSLEYYPPVYPSIGPLCI